MLKNLHNNKGFTFVELMVSIAILALIATAIVGVMSSNSLVFRKSKADLDVQNEAMDSLNQLENDIMQAKYIYIEAGSNKYTCESDKNFLITQTSHAIAGATGLTGIDYTSTDSIITSLVKLSPTDLDDIYKKFKLSSDPTGNRKKFDSYYNKVRYMSLQDRIIYGAFVDSGIGDGTNNTFQSLNKADDLNISTIKLVYPVKLSTPVIKTYTLDDGSTAVEKINYEACVVTYTVSGNTLHIQKDYYDDSFSFDLTRQTSSDYTDLLSGNLVGNIDSKSNSIRLNQMFDKNTRKYNSERTIAIRNSYVLRDQEDVEAAATPTPTPTPTP